MKRSKEQPGNLYTRWERDYDLEAFDNVGLFDEYLQTSKKDRGYE